MDHEQRINMKFCFELQKKSAKETHEMLKLVYDDAVTMKTVCKWFERFRNGCELVEDEERSGHPSTSKTQENVERVSEIIRSNRRLTIREIFDILNISYGSVRNILTTDLNMRRVRTKFVPRVLTVEQKQDHLSISLELRDRAASESSCLGNVITGDETWVYVYDPETRVQSSQWKSPNSQWKSPSSQWKSPNSQWKSPSSQWKSPNSQWKSPSSQWKSPSSQWKSPSSPRA